MPTSETITQSDVTPADATSAEATSTETKFTPDEDDDDDDFQWTGEDANDDAPKEDKASEPKDDDDVIAPLGEEDSTSGDPADMEFKPGQLAETLKLRDGIPDDIKKSIEDHVKGIDKVAQQFHQEREAFEAQAAELVQFHETSRALEAALDDKEQSPATLARLVEAVAKRHGLDPDDVSYQIYEWIADGKVPAVSAPQAKAGEDPRIAQLEKEVADLKKGGEPAKPNAAETRVTTWLDQNDKRVIAKAEKTLGWNVTREQIKEAVTAYPKLDPLDALKKSFPDDYKKSGSKGTATVPPLAKTTHRSADVTAKKPEELTAREVYFGQLGLGKE